MRALVLFLVVGGANCARALSLFKDYPQEYFTRPRQYDTPIPYPTQGRGEPYIRERDVERQSTELRHKHVPSLRTNVPFSQGGEQRHRGSKTSKNREGAPRPFHDSEDRREDKKMTISDGRHTRPVVEFDPRVGAEDGHAAEWVWGSSDAVDTRSRSAKGDLDDRTAISGSNCPTGQIKLEGRCVETH